MVRTQILLNEDQCKALKKIAMQEERSLSDLLREFVNAQLLLREERRMSKAAELLKENYLHDNELTAFAELDGEEFYEKR